MKTAILSDIHEDFNGSDIICNPLGYYPHVWIRDSAEEEIVSTIKMIAS